MTRDQKTAPAHEPMSQFPPVTGEADRGRHRLWLATRVGQTPFYAYDRSLLGACAAIARRAAGRHRAALRDEGQPMPALVQFMAGLVDIDVASAGELQVALNAGADPHEVSFAGPGKRDIELRRPWRPACWSMWRRRVSCRCWQRRSGWSLPARVAIRVNPDFELRARACA